MRTQRPAIFPLQSTSLLINLKDTKKYLSKKRNPEIRIVYYGTPEFSAYVLEKLIEFYKNPTTTLASHLSGGNPHLSKFVIQAVVTNPDHFAKI